MKVLYTDLTITAYSHPLLEKLVSLGCELVMLLPENNDNTVGKNVKEAESKERSYRVLYSRSKRMWYGKPALSNLKKILLQEKPDILMMVFPYFLNLFFDRSIFKILHNNNIRLIIREIPFQTPPFGKLNYFKTHPVYNENMELQSKGLIFKIKTLSLMCIRKYIYSRIDVSLNYASIALEVLPSYGVRQDAIFVSYNTSDTDALFSWREKVINSPRLLPERKRILHIGRLVKWKRVDLLIDAFCIIAKSYPDSELMIIGDGPEIETLKAQARNTNFSEQIQFAGGIYDAEILGKYMYESMVYVLAGMGGLSINDAMCFSLPVICSVCDGTEKDLITDGVNGYFFEEGNVENLAAKIDKMLSNNELQRKMGEASYQVIKNKVNLDTVAKRFIEAFEYALKR
jgi:glycosyltransferase involved in cell wall biosynthesis